ncbi:MAG TPA: mercury methylation ferredoxin HgcB [Candidatus Anoxymicrobiaceae bacterium]
MAYSKVNTLEYDAALCNRCGMCQVVCPHRVFAAGDDAARLVDPDSCMECGACQMNCAPGAIKVDSSVGCASAMMLAALTRRTGKACCG